MSLIKPLLISHFYKAAGAHLLEVMMTVFQLFLPLLSGHQNFIHAESSLVLNSLMSISTYFIRVVELRSHHKIFLPFLKVLYLATTISETLNL